MKDILIQQLRELYIQSLRLHIKADDLPNDDLIAALAIDSVKAMEVLITIETTFGIEIDNDHLNATLLNSFYTLADYLLVNHLDHLSTMEYNMPLDSSITHWNALAHNYDNIMGKVPQMHALFAEIVSHIQPDSSNILDLGAGTGNLLRAAADSQPQATLLALDPAPAMLDILREKLADRAPVQCIVGSASAIELPDNSVDTIVSNYALHHLTHSEKKICAKEVMRVLRSGGKFIYGDQHCRLFGGPEDPEWVADMFELLNAKATHYLHTAGLDRMLLQVELIPKFLKADGEMPVPVEYWLNSLEEAGFPPCQVIEMEPTELLNRVIVATKPAACI